jgi:Protein of unknown function (DUF2934)
MGVQSTTTKTRFGSKVVSSDASILGHAALTALHHSRESYSELMKLPRQARVFDFGPPEPTSNRAKLNEPMERNLSDRIRERAYEIWVASGCPAGEAEQHWLTAERELVSVSLRPAEVQSTRRNKRRVAAKPSTRALAG